MSGGAMKDTMEKKVQAGDEQVKSRLETLRTKSSLHRTICKKRVSGDKVAKVQKLRIRHKFASPTDDLLSPCSQKLTQHKAKLFVAKSNPTKLNFATKHQQNSDEDEDD